MKAMLPPALVATLTLPVLGSVYTPAGLWQLNGNFKPAQPGQSPINAATLTPGPDYSFSSDGAGYQFLQTQTFTTPAKRLTVSNPIGPNGGAGATRTNQWTMIMDVKLDAMQPYAGLVQFDPSNSTDVSIYVFSSNNTTGTLNTSLSAGGAIAVNTWYRLAMTCGNNGSGGGTTLRCYLNGVPTGTPRAGGFDGIQSLQSLFHLFTDNTVGGGDLKPAKLGSFGLWGEELSAADIAALGGPEPVGILPGTIAADAPWFYGANLGWIHAKPAHDGLTAGEYFCSGYAYSVNCGWINFGDGSPANGIRYANIDGADSGVNHDGAGNLSGLAWSANLGWINFGTDSVGSPRSVLDSHRPRVDLSTGQFAGYAYGANVGWINLASLKTSAIQSPDLDNDGLADAWEVERLGNTTSANATTDTDRDGVSDKDEYLADSNPGDPKDRLRILGFTTQYLPGPNKMRWNVSFSSSSRRFYSIETSTTVGSVWSAQTSPFQGAFGLSTNRLLDLDPTPNNFLRVQALKPLQP